MPRAVALSLAAVLLVGCAPREIADERRELLRAWGESFLLPEYERLSQRARSLTDAVESYCDDGSPEGLGEARRAWQLAQQSLKRAEVFAMGPYTDEPLRLGPKLDFWPARADSVEAYLAGSGSLQDTVSLESLGASLRGLPVLEYLLFEEPPQVEPGELDPVRRCRFTALVAADAEATTGRLYKAWAPGSGDYLGELLDAGRGSERFDSLQMALGEVVHRMAFLVEAVRSDKLGIPLGEKSGGTPQPEKVESRFSGRSSADIIDNLDGIERLVFGSGVAREPDLIAYLAGRGYDYAGALASRLQASREAVEALGGPVDQAVVDDPEAVREAIAVLGELQRFLQVDVLNALALTAVFSENDGD